MQHKLDTYLHKYLSILNIGIHANNKISLDHYIKHKSIVINHPLFYLMTDALFLYIHNMKNAVRI